MTLLEAIRTWHKITCEICHSYFELSAAHYTKFEAARMFYQLNWTVANNTVLCPDCTASWLEESKNDSP